MQDVNMRFKDSSPEETVEKIQAILRGVGVELTETWNDSGIETCCSLNARFGDTHVFFSNGKGVTKALARASAYGEFIEHIQCGIMLYKHQSITRDPAMNLQSYAPDAKFMTLQELIDSGEWMDHIIASYGGGLTRERLAKLCQVYACTQEDKIRVLPYHSVFENKTVYLPAGFVEHIYSANGCCAGNTREEAWIHAFSEIIERRSAITLIAGKKSAPQIPDEVIRRYPTAWNILEKIRAAGNYDVALLDLSQGIGYPVIGTRLIDKNTHSYEVDIAADPVLEIAIDRTLTETFQGRALHNFRSCHNGSVLEEVAGIPVAHNVLNQLEHGNGFFPTDFFTDTTLSQADFPEFAHAHEKTNKELVADVLQFYKKFGKPIYVRNNSFLGFHTYQVVVPGISESRAMRLLEPLPEYALGDEAQKSFRNVEAASKEDLSLMITFYKNVSTIFSRVNNFSGLAGLPLSPTADVLLTNVTLAYGAHKLKKYALAASYLRNLSHWQELDADTRDYFSCVCRYMSLLEAGVPEEKHRALLEKFYYPQTVARMASHLREGKSPLEEFLLRCDIKSCQTCSYRSHCAYPECAAFMGRLGEKYAVFRDSLSCRLEN